MSVNEEVCHLLMIVSRYARMLPPRFPLHLLATFLLFLVLMKQ